MKTLKINAYKSENKYGGRSAFDLESNFTNSTNCNSIKHLVECVKGCIDGYSESNKGEEINIIIDLKPLHDIKKSPHNSFKFCLALCPEEKKEFWVLLKNDS